MAKTIWYPSLDKVELERIKQQLRFDLSKLPYSMIVFDEAQNLLSTYSGKTYQIQNHDKEVFYVDFFRLLRRSFRISLFNWKFMWGIVLSTNTKITNFVPQPNEEDPSLRMWVNSFPLPPYLMNSNFDVLAKNYYDHNYQITKPIAYLYSLQRLLDLISCGRPLFYSFFSNFKPKFEEEVLFPRSGEPWIYSWSLLSAPLFQLYKLCKSKISGSKNPNFNSLIRESRKFKIRHIKFVPQ